LFSLRVYDGSISSPSSVSPPFVGSSMPVSGLIAINSPTEFTPSYLTMGTIKHESGLSVTPLKAAIYLMTF